MHVADQQVVGPVVARLVGLSRRLARERQDLLVGLQQPRDLHGHLLPSTRRPRDPRLFGDVRPHGQADPAQQLDPLGDLVHELLCSS